MALARWRLGSGTALAALASFGAFDTREKVRLHGSSKYVEAVCTKSWHALGSGDDVENDARKGLLAQDKTIQTCVGALEIQLGSQLAAAGERGGEEERNCLLLFGPEGCGRKEVVKLLEEGKALEETRGNGDGKGRKVLLVDCDDLSAQRVRSFDWPGISWVMYFTYFALKSYYSWSDLVLEKITEKNDTTDCWVASNVGIHGIVFDPKKDQVEKEIVEGILSSQSVVLLESSTQTLDEFQVRFQSNRRDIQAVRLGDPESDIAKESRLQAVFNSIFSDLVAEIYSQQQPHDSRKELISHALENSIGWRLEDIFDFVDCARLEIAPGKLDLKVTEVTSSLESAAKKVLEKERKRLTELIMENSSSMDDQVAVWLWKMLESLSGRSVAVTGLDQVSTLSKGMQITVLPMLDYIGDGIPMEPTCRTLRYLSQDFLEVVQGPPHLVAARKLTIEAFKDLLVDSKHHSIAFKSMDRKISDVHELQDIYYLGEDIKVYFARYQVYEDALQGFEDLMSTVSDDDDLLKKELLVLEINLDSEKHHLDTIRHDLLRRFRKLYPRQPCNLNNLDGTGEIVLKLQ